MNEGAAAHDPQVSVLERNGRLEITPLANVHGLHFNGYVSASLWDMTGAQASVEVVQATNITSADTTFAVGIDENHWYRIVKEYDQLYFQEKISGAKTSTNITYNAVQHRFWRIRHDAAADVVVFETSADGVTWVEQRRVTRGISLAAVRMQLCSGTPNLSSAPGTAIFDNFRLGR